MIQPIQHLYSVTKILNVEVFLRSAVSSPLDRSKRFTLSFRPQLDFPGKHSSHAAITCEGYSFGFLPVSIARYSFIQLSELRRRGKNENDHILKR